MAVRPLVNLERLTTAHVNSSDGSMTYESGVAYKANTTVSYEGSLYTANVDIEDTDTDTPADAPDKWSLTINAPDTGTSGDISALAARVSALEDTVGDEDNGLVKDVDDLQDDIGNYQLLSQEVLYVDKDDTKTISTLLDELYAAITTRKAALNADEYIRITGVYSHGLGRIVDTANTFRNKTSSLPDLLCMSVNASSTKFSLQRIQLKTSGSKYVECEISANGNVITDLSNTVETVDGYNAKIEIWKKINN